MKKLNKVELNSVYGKGNVKVNMEGVKMNNKYEVNDLRTLMVRDFRKYCKIDCNIFNEDVNEMILHIKLKISSNQYIYKNSIGKVFYYKPYLMNKGYLIYKLRDNLYIEREYNLIDYEEDFYDLRLKHLRMLEKDSCFIIPTDILIRASKQAVKMFKDYKKGFLTFNKVDGKKGMMDNELLNLEEYFVVNNVNEMLEWYDETIESEKEYEIKIKYENLKHNFEKDIIDKQYKVLFKLFKYLGLRKKVYGDTLIFTPAALYKLPDFTMTLEELERLYNEYSDNINRR